MTFDDFNLNEHLMEALSYMGFKDATPIQEQAIPIILEGKDLIASAQTGTGKTAAFLLPILHKLTDKHDQLNTLDHCANQGACHPDRSADRRIFILYACHFTTSIWRGRRAGLGNPKKGTHEGGGSHCGYAWKLISHLNLGYVKV
jgi:ATP-dependent RNA helicase RhlE